MTIAIGRIGVGTAYGGDGRTLNEPFEWAIQGDQVTIQGLYVATSDAQAVSFQAQIAGLDPVRNVDEQAVPITSTLAPTLNGYYTVVDASATIERGSLGPGTGIVKWAVTAIRARDHLYPNIELSHSAAILTNTKSVSSAEDYVAFPNAAQIAQSDPLQSATTRVTAHGSVNQLNQSPAVGAYYRTHVYAIAPADYYQGAVTISTSAGTVVGRGGLASVASAGPVISNGIVRATVAPDSITIAFWDDSTSAWESNKVIEFFNTGYSLVQRSYAASVLKNAADECVLRLSARPQSVAMFLRVTIDLVIRRGDAYVRLVTSANERLRCVTATACTATTWGARSTAADADGQYLLLCGADVVHDLTNGTMTGNAAGKQTYMVGFAEVLGGAARPDSDNVQKGMFRAHGNAQRVVVG